MKRDFSVQASRVREQREARITKMMLIVFGCFLICYLPPFIYVVVSISVFVDNYKSRKVPFKLFQFVLKPKVLNNKPNDKT